MSTSMAWVNGLVVPFTEASLPVWDMGVVAGASVADMARTFRHQPFRLSEHVDRLIKSCRELDFEIPFSANQLLTASKHLITKNVSLISESDDLGIVFFVTAGGNPTYQGIGDVSGPNVVIHTFRLPFEIWRPIVCDGVRLIIPKRKQPSADSLPVNHKTRNRLHWWLADREAHAVRPGSRALLLDDDGHITETSTSCFYGVIDGQIVTPQNNVLNSMSRELVMEAAAENGIAFEQRNIGRSEIAQMSEALVSSTPLGVAPVQSIDNHQFPVWHEDSVLPGLTQFWQKQTSVDPAQQIKSMEERSH